MNTQITTIKTDSVQLPKALRNSWRGSKVWMDAQGDTLVIKRLSRPALDDMLKSFRAAGKGLGRKDVAQAVRWAREVR